jgi:predicted DNA-binding transcriptional regulator AlpA
MSSDRILMLPEVSQRTRTPEATLRWWRHQGVGPKSFKVGKRVMYRENDVDEWLDEQYHAEPSKQNAS